MASPSKSPQASLRSSQIIAAGLIGGPVLFAVVAMAQVGNRPPAPNVIAYVAAGFAAMAMAMSFVIPEVIVKQATARLGETAEGQRESKIFELFQTRLIIRSALQEGAAFFAIVAYMVTALGWLLLVAGALLLAMIIRFPTQGQFDVFARGIRDAGSWNN